MVKRMLSGPLWFISTWCAYELAIYFFAGPRDPGPFIALAVAAYVMVDPQRMIWSAASGAGHRTGTRPSISGVAAD